MTTSSDQGDSATQGELGEARRTIAALEHELRGLRQAQEDQRLAKDLQALVRLVDAGSVLARVRPTTDLLEQCVRTAMRALEADAATLYEMDATTNTLVFTVALGEHAVGLVGRRLSLGRGLAGWVGVTGQTLVSVDLEKETRWASDMGHALGYTPRSVITAPLMDDEHVVGVLQVMDKSGGQRFSEADSVLVEDFARQAAVLLAQQTRLHPLTALVKSALGEQPAADDLLERVEAFSRRTAQGREQEDLLRLATVLADIAGQGPAALRLSLELVGAVRKFLRTSPRRERRSPDEDQSTESDL